MLNRLILGFAFLLLSQFGFAQNTQVVIAGPTYVCQGSCGTYSATFPMQPPPAAAQYFWSGPNGFTSTQQSIFFCFDLPGTYVFKLSAATDAGVSFVSDTITILVVPYTPLNIVSDNPAFCHFDSSATGQQCEKVCPNTTVTYSVQTSSPGGTSSTLSWQVVGAASYTINPFPATSVTVTWGAPGNGSVSVVANGNPNNNCVGEDALCVTIVESPVAKFISDPPEPAGDTMTICKGQTVWFENQSLYADSYEWQFSDNGSLSSAVNPQHTYFNPGIYKVSLIARSACLCADTTQMVLEVLDADAPTLNCVGTVCPGETVTYTAGGGCAPFGWSVTPNGTVLAGGTTGDSITVQWNGGPFGVITLSAPPCAGLACPMPALVRVPVISDDAEIRGADRVCPSSQTVYDIESYGGTSFTWTLSGGGVISSGQGTNRITVDWQGFPQPNTTYWLSVIYDNCYLGCGGRDSIPVHVLSPFSLNGPVERCEDASGTYTAKLIFTNQNLISDWALSAPDGSPSWSSAASAASVIVPFNDGPGLYLLRATPADLTQTCTDYADWSIQVSASPAPLTGIEGPALICTGQPLTYAALGATPDANVQWTIQNGPGAPSTAYGNTLNVNWGSSTPRTLTAVQISTNGLNCASAPAVLNVQDISSLGISGIPNACLNTSGLYSAPPLPGFDFFWEILPAGAGVITQGQGSEEVEVFWQVPGNHILRLTLCGQSADFPMEVYAEPSPLTTAPAGLCAGASATITTTAPFATYDWQSANGTTISTADTALITAGNFILEVTDANGCPGSAEFYVDDLPGPNFTISTNNPTAFCNNSQTVTMHALTTADGDFTYEWFQNGMPLGVNSPTYSTNQYGVYTAQVTNQFGCTATAGPISVIQDCGGPGGGGGFPGGGGPACQPGDVTLTPVPTAACDSFVFQAAGPNYLPGSAQWTFGQSGAATLGTSLGDMVSFEFQNAGQYIVALIAQLQGGGVCLLYDSVNVAAVAQFNSLPACPGANSNFQDVSTFLPGSGISNWSWDFGDPSTGTADTSTVRNASHAFSASGSFPVTLTVTANSGCTSSNTENVVIPGGPVFTFAAPAAVCAGTPTEFNLTPPAGITDVSWNFGDPSSGSANTASGEQVFHNFSSNGNYTVTATLTNGFGCTGTYSRSVAIATNSLSGTINPNMPAPFCEGKFVVLSAPPGGVLWSWSDSITTTQALAVTEEGTYSVTMTDANGCTYVPPPVAVDMLPSPDAIIKALLTNDLGQVIGTAYPTLDACAGEDVTLVIQGNGSYSYQWSSGGTATTQYFDSNHGGTLSVGSHLYTVTVTDGTSGCTTVTDPFLVDVHPVPSGFSVSASASCADDANTLTYTGPQPANWQIFWNTGATGPMAVAEEGGTYFVRVLNEFGCEAESNHVTVLPGPNVAAIPGGCHARCRPDSLCLPNLPGITSWQWFYNGTAIPGATSPDFVADSSGTYWAEVTDASGCAGQSDPLTLDLYDGYGNVLGQVWSDVNNNGAIDAGDTLVSGVAVILKQNGNPNGMAQSGAGGDFAFVNILSTNYEVEIDTAQLPDGWTAIIPKDSAALSGCGASAGTDLLVHIFSCETLNLSLTLGACSGDSAVYSGVAIPAGTSQDFLSFTPDGCPVTTTVNVVASPTSTLVLDAVTCQNVPYIFNGVNIAAGTSQTFYYQNFYGCDSIIMVNVTGVPTSQSSVSASACPGGSYTYNGTAIAAGSSQDFTFQNFMGCDSIVTVTVAALATSTSTLNVSACTGAFYDFNGNQVAAGTSQNFTLQNFLGCDSVVTVNVAELATSAATLEGKACPGEPYFYNGTPIPIGTSQTFTFLNSVGCDSVLTVTASALPVSSSNLNVSACPGGSYDYNGTPVAAGTSQNFTLQNYLGCDSVVTVNVATLPTSATTLNVKACPGETYAYQGSQIPAGSSQDFILQNYLGCDSTVTVVVAVAPTFSATVEAAVCPGDSFVYDGVSIPAGDSQVFTYQTTLGCDSTVMVAVSAWPAVPPSSVEFAICPGETYTYNGVPLAAGATQDFTLTSFHGCDSVVTVTIREVVLTSQTLPVQLCPGETFAYQGQSLAPGDSTTFHFTGYEGCDSAVTVVVMAWPATTFEVLEKSSCATLPTGALTIQNLGGGTPPILFSLNGGPLADSTIFSPLEAGPYTLTAEDANGCTATQDAYVHAAERLHVVLPNGVLPCDSTGVQMQPVLTGDTTGLSFLWSNALVAPYITAKDAGLVWVDVTNECETVRGEAVVSWADVAGDTSLVYLPNVFAPAATFDVNAMFRPFFAAGLTLLDYQMEVFDRWGNLLYRTSVPEDGWTGPFRKKDMQPGVFVWQLEAHVAFCGRIVEIRKVGDVTIVR